MKRVTGHGSRLNCLLLTAYCLLLTAYCLLFTLLLAVPAHAQTVYKSYIGKEDVKSWDGVTTTFDRKTSTGGGVTMTKTDYEVDVAKLGGGYTDTAIRNVQGQIPSTSQATLVLYPGTWAIAATTTINSNITLKVMPGVYIDRPDRITINGRFVAGRHKIFAASLYPTFAAGAVEDVYPEWWDAKGNGTTNDYAALLAAVQAAAGQAYVNLAPYVTYGISTELNLRTSSTGPKVKGNWATIKSLGAMTNTVSIGPTSCWNAYIENLIIDANSYANYAFKPRLVLGPNSRVVNIKAKNGVLANVWALECQSMEFTRIGSDTTVDGILIDGCNNTTWNQPRAITNAGNTGTGIKVTQGSATGISGGCTLNGPDVETHQSGIDVVDTTAPVVINYGWMEGIPHDGLIIRANDVWAHHLRISGGGVGTADAYSAVRIKSGAKGAHVTENKLSSEHLGAGDAPSYASPYDENTAGWYNTLEPNYATSGQEIPAAPDGISPIQKVIGGTKTIANTATELFSVLLGTNQSVVIQFWAEPFVTGVTNSSFYQLIVAAQNGGGGGIITSTQTAVIAENGSSGGTITFDVATANTLKVKLNHASATPVDVPWRAVIIGNYGTITKL